MIPGSGTDRHREHPGADHLAFGQGPHLCLGAHFGRPQPRIFFRELLRRLPPLELDGPVTRLTSNFLGGITHMPVRWTVRGRPV